MLLGLLSGSHTHGLFLLWPIYIAGLGLGFVYYAGFFPLVQIQTLTL